MIFSTATFGTLSIFVRNISLPSGELALYRALLAAAFVAVFLIVTKNPHSLFRHQKGNSHSSAFRQRHGNQLDSSV